MAAVLKGVEEGPLTLDEVKRRFGLSAEELTSWRCKIEKNGVPALRTTRAQIYEPERRKGYRPPAGRLTGVAADAFR